MATRCCMPPDNCHGWAPAASASPIDASASATSSPRRSLLNAACFSRSSTFRQVRGAALVHARAEMGR